MMRRSAGKAYTAFQGGLRSLDFSGQHRSRYRVGIIRPMRHPLRVFHERQPFLSSKLNPKWNTKPLAFHLDFHPRMEALTTDNSCELRRSTRSAASFEKNKLRASRARLYRLFMLQLVPKMASRPHAISANGLGVASTLDIERTAFLATHPRFLESVQAPLHLRPHVVGQIEEKKGLAFGSMDRIHVPPSRVEPHSHIVWRGLHELVQRTQRTGFSRFGLQRNHPPFVLQQEIHFRR